MPETNHPRDTAGELPIHNFSRCHDGIRAQLESLARLPQQQPGTPQRTDIARQALTSFRTAMFDHHGEEEKELFPAVLAASNTEEYGRLRAMAEALTAEHRQIEALWQALEPALEQVALGKPVTLDEALLQDMVARYGAHARLEEDQFLPMAETILGRKDPSMAALGLSLHMRHQLRAASRNEAITTASTARRTV